MRAHYDFASMRERGNPYARLLKRPVTIRIEAETISYFRSLSARTGLPYQSLINLYLRDCAVRGKEPSLLWETVVAKRQRRAAKARRKV